MAKQNVSQDFRLKKYIKQEINFQNKLNIMIC